MKTVTTIPQLKIDGTWPENREWYYSPMNGHMGVDGKTPSSLLVYLDEAHAEIERLRALKIAPYSGLWFHEEDGTIRTPTTRDV